MDHASRAERLNHWLFLSTLLAKGLLGVVQLLTAAAIFLGITDRLPALARSLVANELAEDPNDFLAARILDVAGMVPNADTSFYGLYFAAHGMLHVGVVAALLIGSVWAYPAAIAVLAVFVVYQIFEWISVGGAMLPVLSAIDIFVIYLTAREWRYR